MASGRRSPVTTPYPRQASGQQPVTRDHEPEGGLANECPARVRGRVEVAAPAPLRLDQFGPRRDSVECLELMDVQHVVGGAGDVHERMGEEVVARPIARVPTVDLAGE